MRIVAMEVVVDWDLGVASSNQPPGGHFRWTLQVCIGTFIIWLVVDLPLWKIWWTSVGMMTFPTEWKVIIHSCSKPPTSNWDCLNLILWFINWWIHHFLEAASLLGQKRQKSYHPIFTASGLILLRWSCTKWERPAEFHEKSLDVGDRRVRIHLYNHLQLGLSPL